MKISLGRGPRAPLSPQTAWGCLTSNLALPGSGTLLAGRLSGYGQLLMTGIGFFLSLIYGVRYLAWQFSNWSRLLGPGVDPVSALQEVWFHLRWTLLGVGIFLISMLWALVSSLAILDSARKANRSGVPPRLT